MKSIAFIEAELQLFAFTNLQKCSHGMELSNYTFNFLTAVTYRRCDSNFVKPQIVLLQLGSCVKQGDRMMLQLGQVL